MADTEACPGCGTPVSWSPSLVSNGMHGGCEAAFCVACNKIHLRGNADGMTYVRMVWRNSTRDGVR
jgi:endogenous inhibitor of DNA gyrase (YacG/DUF329 family)